jgi:DNA-binding response OmpR family regulator
MVMNSEPSGTDADILGGESAIDIFILCKDDRDSLDISGQLASRGYRVTLFSESADLLAALHEGKPNLLVCDATDEGREGCEICRGIKADSDLWRIPVLLITGVASLSDLLSVLDSNADNFIARPYDPHYLLSLIETMLSSPVEKPDPEKIRTQFKIRHEDRDYVIMADRRKLLEFLLSSFEIAVDRAGELVQVHTALESLTSTLERRVADRTRELSTETARLQMLVNGKTHELETAAKALEGEKKEGAALRSLADEHEKTITGLKEESIRVTQELESTRARLAEAEDTIHTLGTEKNELEAALRGDAESLNRDLAQTRKEFDDAKKDIADLSGQRNALEAQVFDLSRARDEDKKALDAFSVEVGQLKSTLATEKSRAESAEVEVKSILQEKAKSEQDLRQMVEDITGRATQQSQECLRLSDALAAEKEGRAAIEAQCAELTQEAAKKEAAFTAEKSTRTEQHTALQQKYDALTESFGAERQKCQSLEAEFIRVTGEKEEAGRSLQEMQEKLREAVARGEEAAQLRATAEAGAAEAAAAKESEIQALKTDCAALRNELEGARADLVAARQDLDATQGTNKDLNDKLAAAALARAQADKLARSSASEAEQIRDELATERRLHHTTGEKLSEIIQAKEQAERERDAAKEQAGIQERELFAKIQGLTEAVDAERDARARAEDALAQVTPVLETADRKLKTAEEEKAAARITGEESAARERELRARIQELTDSLDTERDAHAKVQDELDRVNLQREVAEKQLRAAGEERSTELARRDERIAALETDLRELRKLHATAEPVTIDARHREQAASLKEDLRTARDRQRSLEEQLRASEQELAGRDAAMQALSRELNQATAALAAEKEGRYAAEEAYTETRKTLAELRKKPQVSSTTIEEIPLGEHALAARPPDLPATIRMEPHALAQKAPEQIIVAQQAAPEDREDREPDIPQVRIRSVEDLFEEPTEIGADELPDAAREFALAAEGDLPVEAEDESGLPEDEEEHVETDTEEDERGDVPGRQAGAVSHNAGIPVFSREQWFDLMKWAHNSGALSHEERLRIVKIGRLIQKGRILTRRQEAQLAELMLLAHAKGYQPQE